MNKEIKWPMQLKDAIDLMFSHNEIIALWYSSKEYDEGYCMIYRGEAWATPELYRNLEMKRFFGCVPEKIHEGDTINILMTVDEDTLVKNLPKKSNNNQNATEEEMIHATISQ